jgi:hypothetical protein
VPQACISFNKSLKDRSESAKPFTDEGRVGNPGHVDFGYARSSLKCSIHPHFVYLYPSHYLLNSTELLAQN